MKQIFGIALIILLCSSTLIKGQDMKKSEFLPISVWYSGGKVRAPMLSEITPRSEAEWRKDLEQIKALGFNTVRTWVEWAHCEPKPGEYDFENLKLLCKVANELWLRVIVQMYVDSAPDWVGKMYPDGSFETQSGDRVHSQAAPGYCTDHPGVREAVLNFYTETAKVASQYPNLHGWDLWSEPHIVNWAYINWVPDVQFCYCPHTQSRFRAWLQQKYGDLETLNKAWYRNFESWDDVEPPRFGTILSYTDFIDWKNFIYDKLAGDLRMRYEAVRKGDPTHVITSHAAVPSIFYSPYNGYGATDDFLMAEQVDYYGTSLYPKHNHPDRHWENWKFALAVDFSRSANKRNGGFYVGELQAGKGTIGLNIGDPITPGDHRIWIWSIIARGGKAVNIYAYYPMSSGYESGGYGLINLDGSITERAKSAGETARYINTYQSLFLSAAPAKAEVALLYNPLAQMVGGEQRHTTGDMHYQSLVGYYQFLLNYNIPVDFIHRRDLEAGDLQGYKLLIVPYPLMFTERAAESLKQFIYQGGKVLSEARLAWNDERGFAAEIIPGMGLAEVFGAVETDIRMSKKFYMKPSSVVHPVLARLSPGDMLHGSYFAETITPIPTSQAQILATAEDGSPAMVMSHYGQGETICVGSFIGLANFEAVHEGNYRFLDGLMNWADITRHFSSSVDGKLDKDVEIRLSQFPGGQLLYLINHGAQAEPVDIVWKVEENGKVELTEILKGRLHSTQVKDDRVTFSTTIDGRDVQIWKVGELKK